MNLVKFIDCRFQELRLKEQDETTNQEYSLTRDSEVLALQGLLKFIRAFTKYIMIPKVIFGYILVVTGYRDKPRPVLVEKLKAQMAEQKEKASVLESLKNQKTGTGNTVPSAT